MSPPRRPSSRKRVPLAARKPSSKVEPGTVFEGTGARLKWGKRQLNFNEAANVATSFKTAIAGTYRVKLELEVNGSYFPDPGKARVVVKVDGHEMLNQEFAYYDEKAFTFETKQKWPADATHAMTIELTPTVPAAKKETIIDLFVTRVTVEGPLEPAHWVKTENYDRYFPREVPKSRDERRAYAEELLSAFAEKAYRRPLQDDTGERLAALAEATYTQKGKSFEQGVAHAMAAVLAIPRFLFRLGAGGGECDRPASPTSMNTRSPRACPISSGRRCPMPSCSRLASRGELRKNLAAQVDAHAQGSARGEPRAQLHRPVAAGARRRRHREQPAPDRAARCGRGRNPAPAA